MSIALYRGPWPNNISRLAKYAVRFTDGEWKVTVLYDAGDGLRYLAVDGGGAAVAKQVNAVKSAVRDQPGGAFYVNEYRHIIVPVAGDFESGPQSVYYFAGRFNGDFNFEFDQALLSTRPIDRQGSALKPGDTWIGPRPGIPYVLAAGGSDVYFETPALTDTDPPEVRERMTRRVMLSKVLRDTRAAAETARKVSAIRSHSGGRFYVNEHGAMFTPVTEAGAGISYIYCGQLDMAKWFPEPRV